MLDNVILMLWPTINPDGQSDGRRLVHVARRHAATRRCRRCRSCTRSTSATTTTATRTCSNMIESRVMEHTWRQWEPNIIYVHHQSSPFPTRIWLPPFAEPIATHAPRIMSREVNMIGMAIAQRLDEEGKVGATHMGDGYDAWYPGYIDYSPIFKNIPAFWTETQGTGPAPRTSQPNSVPPNMRRPQALYVESVARRHVAAARCGRVHGQPRRSRRSSTRAKYKDSLLYDRYQSGPRSDRARARARRRTRTSFRRTSAIRSPRSRCCGASRSAACACRS